MDAEAKGILTDYRTGPERAGISIEPKAPKPPGELRRDTYTTEQALEVFDGLLLLAACVPPTTNLNKHPLVLVQAAKALVGLRPETPSQRLMDFAFHVCEGIEYKPPDRDLLRVSSDELGEIVSVHELERAILDGDLEGAQKQAGRLITVSDNKSMLFDILLEVAARYPNTAVETVPFLHYAQRAMAFVGTRNAADFLLPALEVVVRDSGEPPDVIPDTSSMTPWEAIPYLANAPLEVINLAAHAIQIEADEHIKGRMIRNNLERSLAVLAEPLGKAEESEIKSQSSSAADLLAAVIKSETDKTQAIGRFLSEQGERAWLQEVLEGAGEKQFSPELVLWADSFRMLLRMATEQYRSRLGKLAGITLAQLIQRESVGGTG